MGKGDNMQTDLQHLPPAKEKKGKGNHSKIGKRYETERGMQKREAKKCKCGQKRGRKKKEEERELKRKSGGKKVRIP